MDTTPPKPTREPSWFLILTACLVTVPLAATTIALVFFDFEAIGIALCISLWCLPSLIVFLILRTFKPKHAWKGYWIAHGPLTLLFLYMIIVDTPSSDLSVREFGFAIGSVYLTLAIVAGLTIITMERYVYSKGYEE